MPKKTKLIKKTDLKGNKPWLKKIGIEIITTESLDKRKSFLIVCEGQTEELYFKSFPVASVKVEPVHLGCSKSKLVECTEAMCANQEYDEVWCIFDRDYKGEKEEIQDYNNAIDRATHKGYRCGYSNDAFELWFVLHYQLIDQQQLRTFYFEKLSERWDMNYIRDGKKREFAITIYDRLQMDENSNQPLAIDRAKNLHEAQRAKKYHDQNPVTTVYELVVELNKHLKK